VLAEFELTPSHGWAICLQFQLQHLACLPIPWQCEPWTFCNVQVGDKKNTMLRRDLLYYFWMQPQCWVRVFMLAMGLRRELDKTATRLLSTLCNVVEATPHASVITTDLLPHPKSSTDGPFTDPAAPLHPAPNMQSACKPPHVSYGHSRSRSTLCKVPCPRMLRPWVCMCIS